MRWSRSNKNRLSSASRAPVGGQAGGAAGATVADGGGGLTPSAANRRSRWRTGVAYWDAVEGYTRPIIASTKAETWSG